MNSLKLMNFKYVYFIFFLMALFLISTAKANNINPFKRLINFNQPLKLYAPQELTMVGSISHDDGVLGIVRTPDNKVYTVKPGSPVGNSGYVVDVSPKKITVQQNSQMIELPLRQIR